MKEIVILSGKGGTGKTSLVGSLAFLAEHKIMVDCDVDVADLHLLLDPEPRSRNEFRSGVKAPVVSDHCSGCGTCVDLCQFGAITTDQGGKHVAFFERNTNGRAQGFLPATKENAAMDSSRAPKRGKPVVQHARQQHEPIRGKMRITRAGKAVRRFGVGHRLQHGGILPTRLRASNASFRVKRFST